MSKRSRERRRLEAIARQGNNQARPAGDAPAIALIAAAGELERQSTNAIGAAAVAIVETPTTAVQEDLRLAVQMAQQAKANFEAATAALKSKAEQIEKDSAENVKRRESLDQREKDVNARLAKAEDLEKANAEELKKLSDRAADLVHREENAKDGFLKERMAHLATLQNEAAKLRTTIDETSAFTTQKRVDCERECAERVSALGQKEEELKAQERQIEQRERKARWQEEDLEELATARAAYEVERARLEKQDMETRLRAARDEAERRELRVREVEDILAKLGGRSVEDVIAANKQLMRDLDDALKQLETRPAAETGRYVAQLEAKCQELRGTIHDLQRELAESRTKASAAVIAVTEVESLRDEKLASEKRCELLKNANDTLHAEYEQILSKAGEKTPFESCSQKDVDEELQSAPTSLLDEIEDLPAFCEELQQRIAYDPETGKTLYYSIEDVRCLIAGLCTSKLHILQGISGTGKTSLPKAFARAVGAGCRLVPVQAGWRDREDLIGHYNSFQNKYYESEFLKALYDAQCPAFADRPFVIILDEMNLSHPEQYFADFISLMEQEQSDQIVTLTTFPVPNAPKLFVNGSQLCIPPNVWFIGTANHDETTMDLADKTYDRAHVMELPRHRSEFAVNKRQRRQDALALNGLMSAIDLARRTHGAIAKRVTEYLDKEFLGLLGDSFGIGWGNRLERQLGFYVPMVMACGGSIGEATDHILATKLLRRLRGRHDNEEKALKEVQAALDDKWIEKKHEARKSRAVIEEAMRLVV